VPLFPRQSIFQCRQQTGQYAMDKAQDDAVKKTPNPRRVAAGKLNRAKRKPLSAEARERLRKAAIANKPWLHSTGPRTSAGKVKVAQNSRGRQKGGVSMRAVHRDLAEMRSLLAEMRALRGLVPGRKTTS
jgi:hypothetical protein